jgi:long-chain acyl-CoA synthetase
MMLSPSRNVSRLLADTASRHPERTAIVFGDDRITYAALDAAANRVANLLV